MTFLYNAIEFRSSLEVSWARFFDGERMKWLYEPETFREGKYSYTPDFQLNGRIWIEVKGEKIPVNRSLRLCPRPLIVLFGSPRSHWAAVITDRLVRYPSFEAVYDRL